MASSFEALLHVGVFVYFLLQNVKLYTNWIQLIFGDSVG